MSDYTPRTHEVREGWVYYCYEAFWLMKNRRTDYREQFDRWLAAHDAKVYQRGREDAAKAVEALGSLRCYEVYEADDGYLAGSYYEVDAIAAARGDGEQE